MVREVCLEFGETSDKCRLAWALDEAMAG
jgi:hypothetical protein